ncbi:hypothetical protein [Planctomicrobium sp. SH527]|uniref:hypothetical protein n=1 Tax=Planctomicrobium sp. SH527 TaxID=3448123 RepID=UPI003F5C1463
MLCKKLAIVFALSLFTTGCSQPSNVMTAEEEAAANASNEQAVEAERDRDAAEAKAKKRAK